MKNHNIAFGKIVAALLVTLVMVNAVMQLFGASPEPRNRLFGFPEISETYSPMISCSIDQIVEDDRYIYVLFGEHKGNVQVFDLDGVYQYTAYFYTHMNGAFRLAVDNHALYVRDEHHNVYILQNGAFVSFVAKENAADFLEMLNFDASSENYEVRLGSIWKVNGEEKECVVERPLIAILYQNDFMFFAKIAIIAIFGIIFRGRKRKNYEKGSQ